MARKKDWEALEERVRKISSYIWNCPAHPERINGVSCYVVLKPESDQWIIIEVTKSSTLEKLRTDLAKFASVRPHLISKGIYAKCFFVCSQAPSEHLIETGRGQHVEVLSHEEMEQRFFDYPNYHYVRSAKRFGSAVDPLSGKKDERPYIPVHYEDLRGKRQYTLPELLRQVINGHNVILLGNYGTGKSRCVQELFYSSKEAAAERHIYPLAIDLRENWGLRRSPEILRRHFDDLGLSQQADSIIKIIDKDAVCLFLDGFDEIVSQVWSDDPIQLEAIRSESLIGVRDIIDRIKGGVFITGRDHYFNSNDEMFRCLGLSLEKTLVVTCSEEFSEEQMNEYLREVAPSLTIPRWLPRRPLISQILANIEAEKLKRLLEDERGEVQFWYALLDAICAREAQIHQSLQPETIRSVLLEVSQKTRSKLQNVGPISLSEINEAFEYVVKRPPRDEASAMLQRLPTLGRVEAETSDRQFLDVYILDGLRAVALIESVNLGTADNLIHEKWTNPLGEFGRSLLMENMISSETVSMYLRILKRAVLSTNKILAGDILSAMLAVENGQIDFENLRLTDSHISALDLVDSKAHNLHLEECIIEDLRISPKSPMNITMRECMIGTLRGSSPAEGLPKWIQDSSVEQFDALTNVARIREANLSVEQRIFVTIVHKTFFQPGGGRKVEALLRGLGGAADKRAARRILSFLTDEGILDNFPGQNGIVYTPVRKHTHRMGKILSQLQQSRDQLWIELR